MALTLQILLLGLVALSSARKIAFTDCGSTDGVMQSIDITPCAADPCHVHKGETITATATFKMGAQGSDKLIVKTYAIVHGFKVPVATNDACSELQNGAQCPVKPNTVYTAKGTATVKKLPPFTHKIFLESHYVDGNDKILICIKYPVIIDRHGNVMTNELPEIQFD